MTHKDLPRLLRILSFKRPHGSKSEQDCVEEILTSPYKHDLFGPMENVCITVPFPDSDATPRTLFSCHTDTVHHQGGMQEPGFDAGIGLIYVKQPKALEKAAETKSGKKTKKTKLSDRGWMRWNDCLGADDGAGMWLMLQMIDASVPGVYLFHRGEERGGIGSSWMAAEMPDWLRQFDRAVAFDRRGTTSVITHQAGDRCASDEFALALAEQLTPGHAPDDTGVFTDTANYTHLIPECTNLSCGYEHEHSSTETLDVEHLVDLAGALLKVSWEALPTVRTVADTSFDPRCVSDIMDLAGLTLHELRDYVKENPDDVAWMLADMIDAELFEREQLAAAAQETILSWSM